MEQEIDNSEYSFGILIKSIAILSSIYGMVQSVEGWKSFTYFTILSNLFITFMLAIFLVRDIKLFLNREVNWPNYLYVVKFLATISITLTFVVFLTLLAPTNPGGILNSYLANGAGSLCVHFITPILAIIDFCLFDYEYKSNYKHSLYATVPPLLYAGSVVVFSKLGLRWGEMCAPYNFLNYCVETGWFGWDLSLAGWKTLGIGVVYMIILLLVIFILLGVLFLFLKDRMGKKKDTIHNKIL